MARYRQSQSENRHTRPIGQAITASHIDFQPKINSGLLSGVPLEYILAYLRPSAPLTFGPLISPSVLHGLLSGVPLEYILAYLRPSAPLAFRYIVTCSPISFFEKLSIGYSQVR